MSTAISLTLALLPATDCAAIPAKVEALAQMHARGWHVAPMPDPITNGVIVKLLAGEPAAIVREWALSECLIAGNAYGSVRLAGST